MNKEWTGERLETNIWGETTAEHLHRYAIALDLVTNRSVLDLACGEGYGSYLLSKNAGSVTGIDIDNATIEKAGKKYIGSNLRFLTGSATSIPLQENAFDVIVSFETIEHLTDYETMMKECKRVLKPNGLLIISTPNKKKYSAKPAVQNPFHLKELTKDEFASLLQKKFSQVKILDQYAAYSSFIADETIKEYAGDYNNIHTGHDPQPLYFIALASDERLPVIGKSIFNAAAFANKALEEKERSLRTSSSYKAGNFILSPFKFIRRLFGKKKNA